MEAVNRDIDREESLEWLNALEAVIERDGHERAHLLLGMLLDRARMRGANIPYRANTAYINTIPYTEQVRAPGDYGIEARLRSYVRWNALAAVVKANRKPGDLGGHIASFASAATLYDVGFNHFFRASLKDLKPEENRDYGDLVFFQGHSSPGVYARAFLEGRITEEQLLNFRSEVGGKGLSSYPHPWLMPDFWQFPTVSMGLGPIQAIYQAKFMRYLENRGLLAKSNRKIWAFMGDGEMDEPESLGAISLAAREDLDNLIFVVNCNLQRLDGPVRGNGKIIQELESEFLGAGWNVIKLIWGSYWDPLITRDKTGILLRRMEEAVDGDYQAYKANSGDYVRKEFFGKYPELEGMVAHMTDEDIWRLNRGGHDPHKVYAAYHAAVHHQGQPTVILIKTIKGYGMGDAGEARNINHQQKKVGDQALKRIRDRFGIPIPDSEIDDVPFYRPPEDSPEMAYLRARVEDLGGPFPARKSASPRLKTPALSSFGLLLEDSGKREFSTTMAFVRILNALVRDPNIGMRIVPIVADESRTFGMEGMFRQLGIYSAKGQRYVPEDADKLMFYKEADNGQILQEGISEAGGMCSWIAAGTSYSNFGIPMIPFFIFYSMFGFQRIGDLAWAAGDIRSRGFLIGGTSGRTTLNGEGLQHADGNSQIHAGLVPNCESYDPTYAYELAVIVQDGLRRMYQEHEDVYYYITAMNENYHHPAMPKGHEKDIVKGMHRIAERKPKGRKKPAGAVRLLGSGAILLEVLKAADLLADDYQIASTVWSVTSFNRLAREGGDVARRNMLAPGRKPEQSHVGKCLSASAAPTVAATDYVRNYADQIREFVPGTYIVLGTDGFGRSDTRTNLRDHFEVDSRHIAVAALSALLRENGVAADIVKKAIAKLGIDPSKPSPRTL